MQSKRHRWGAHLSKSLINTTDFNFVGLSWWLWHVKLNFQITETISKTMLSVGKGGKEVMVLSLNWVPLNSVDPSPPSGFHSNPCLQDPTCTWPVGVSASAPWIDLLRQSDLGRKKKTWVFAKLHAQDMTHLMLLYYLKPKQGLYYIMSKKWYGTGKLFKWQHLFQDSHRNSKYPSIYSFPHPADSYSRSQGAIACTEQEADKPPVWVASPEPREWQDPAGPSCC